VIFRHKIALFVKLPINLGRNRGSPLEDRLLRAKMLDRDLIFILLLVTTAGNSLWSFIRF
jgi:hypothetical protein